MPETSVSSLRYLPVLSCRQAVPFFALKKIQEKRQAADFLFFVALKVSILYHTFQRMKSKIAKKRRLFMKVVLKLKKHLVNSVINYLFTLNGEILFHEQTYLEARCNSCAASPVYGHLRYDGTQQYYHRSVDRDYQYNPADDLYFDPSGTLFLPSAMRTR